MLVVSSAPTTRLRSPSVIGLDVRRDDERAVPGARMGMGGGMVCVWGGEPAPGQREVEGRGGAFW